MSRLNIPEGPYSIETIMDWIRSDVLDQPEPQEGGGPASPSAVGREDGTVGTRLASAAEMMRERQALDPDYRIHSHRRVIGRVIDGFKRVIHWGSRPYTDAVRERQERVNEAALEAVERLVEAVTDLQARVDRSGAALSRLEQRHEEAVGGFEQRMDRSDGTLACLDQQQGRLERGQEALFARHDVQAFLETVDPGKRLTAMDQTRGTEEAIGMRQAYYVELFKSAPGQILDLGCGRGELLARLRHQGIECWGVDIDSAMVAQARAQGVHVQHLDGLEALRSVEPGSLGGIFAGQVIEHLFPGQILELIGLARSRLAPSARLVLETLNPRTLAVLAKSYYSDLEHKQAIHPAYLKGLLEMAGFEAVEVHELAPFEDDERLPELPEATALGWSEQAREALEQVIDRLNHQIYGCQDYYVTAEQPASGPGSREGAA